MTRLFGSLLVGALLGGCAPYEPAIPDRVGVRWHGVMIEDVGGCSTAAVAGLSAQLIAEQNCLRPGVLASFAGTPNVTVGGAVNALLEPPAVAALQQAAMNASQPIAINSAFRTLAQQYLLKKWEGTCGITLAASPGSSNHETGLAIDVANHAEVRIALENAGWDWLGASDVVHFDFEGAGTIDLRADSVLGFQRLWNRNHPQELLTEDGDYGTQTAQRLGQSPAEGFPIGAACDDSLDLARASVDLSPRADLGEAPPAADLATPDDLQPELAPGRIVYGGCTATGVRPSASALALALALALARLRRRQHRA